MSLVARQLCRRRNCVVIKDMATKRGFVFPFHLRLRRFFVMICIIFSFKLASATVEEAFRAGQSTLPQVAAASRDVRYAS